MTTRVALTTVYVLDLDESLTFYTELLGLEKRTDAPLDTMRWLTVGAPGETHELLLAAVDQHVPDVDQPAMRELVVKGVFPVFLHVADVDATFERLNAANVEVLQEPIDQPYGLRDCAVRDPSGNHLRIGWPIG